MVLGPNLFKRNGDWWSQTGEAELRLLDVAPTLEAEVLEDKAYIRLRELIAVRIK